MFKRLILNALISLVMGFNKVVTLSQNQFFRVDPLVEPETQTDAWDALMEKYTNGTEDEQKHAEWVLTSSDPVAKKMCNDAFLSRWSGDNVHGKQPAAEKGESWDSPSTVLELEKLRQLSEANAREQLKKGESVQ